MTVDLGGSWRLVGGVMRWSPEPTVSEVVDLRSRMRPASPRPLDVGRFIACPTCGAKADERCKSAAGNSRADHADRLVSVRCPCGQPVQPRKQYCEPCRQKARLRTYRLREIRRPTTLRRSA